ncbi:hypothetical protein [Avibacterium volantium]|uniref:Uncharacterized protein n=1 Tax=Avibacterium volantium TaxID=762 RepID=A0A3S4L025_AVIVO|nr:hypothetical protein [Avibacterium volantium]VEB24402.1 Uncharacterised protein [Avibacterium volantium]
MRSFILGYLGSSDSSSSDKRSKNVGLDIHINLWNSQYDRNKYYIDIGLMIEDISLVESILIYVPFKILKPEDLAKTLVQDRRLLSAIFNKKVNTNSYEGVREHLQIDDDDVILYKLRDEQFRYTPYSEYTKIEIQCTNILSKRETENDPKLKKYKKYYFRFRIKPENISTIIKKENQDNKVWQDPSLRTTETIDFRINELRSCPDELRESYLEQRNFDIKTIHYLIIRNSSDTFINVDSKALTSRLLEHEIWENYLPKEIDKEKDMMAYHFKEKNNDGIKVYTNLSQFSYLFNVKKRLCIYFLISMFIAIIASYISSFIYDHL